MTDDASHPYDEQDPVAVETGPDERVVAAPDGAGGRVETVGVAAAVAALESDRPAVGGQTTWRDWMEGGE